VKVITADEYKIYAHGYTDRGPLAWFSFLCSVGLSALPCRPRPLIELSAKGSSECMIGCRGISVVMSITSIVFNSSHDGLLKVKVIKAPFRCNGRIWSSEIQKV
jgi:hypothetical protein